MAETPTPTTPAPTAPEAAEAILNAPTLLIGPSKSGKSSLLATAAEYVWETYQKVSLYYLCDGGGMPSQMQALVNVGIVRLWRMRTRNAQGLAQETCDRAARGWWPRRINPKTGESAPAVEMVPPITTRYTMHCPAGHVVKVVPFQSMLTPTLCTQCRTHVTRDNMQVTQDAHPTKGFEQVGACLYDGLSSICSWLAEDLAERTGRNELGGEKTGLGGVVVSGSMMFGSNNRAQVGFVQNRAEALALGSGGIPNLVIPPIWTALTHETSDESGMLTVRGPLLIGQAKTAVATQWFGDSMEAITVVDPAGKKYRRLMLHQWIDERNTRHLCGVRSYPGLLPEYLEDLDAPGEPAFVNFNLGTFFKERDAARAKTEASYRERYPDAPGVGGEMEYGEAVVLPEAAAASAAPAPAAAAVAQKAGPKAGPKAAPKAAAKPVPQAAKPAQPAAQQTAPSPAPARPAAPAPPLGAKPAPAATAAPAAQQAGPATATPATPPPPKAPARAAVAPPAGKRPAPRPSK